MALRGTITTALIIGGVGLLLYLNRQPAAAPTSADTSGTSIQGAAKSLIKPGDEAAKPPSTSVPVRAVEHPIGEEVIKNHIQVAAVWLSSVGMDGRPISEGRSLIHVEADIRATANNPNGFANHEFIPYLKIRYKVIASGSTKPVQAGEMLPMIAFDGLHYGANIEMPAPGKYQLIYEVDPPSAGGLGRHSDPVTGVAPWWEPFQAEFEWIVASSS